MAKALPANNAIEKMETPATDLGFSHKGTRLGEVHIFRDGKQVATLRGKVAAKFLAKVQGADDSAVQQVCARATGNYKRGNETAAATARGAKRRES